MHKEVLRKFKISGLKYFYGDFFDSRIYVAHYLSKMKTRKILDVGCSSGVLLNCLPNYFKVGVDIDFNALKQSKKLDSTIEVIACDAQFLPFKKNIFETITTMHLFPVIYNMKGDWKEAVEEIMRVSMDKNMLIITGANRTSRHFGKTHSIDHRKKYLNYKQQIEILSKYYDISIEGYGPHPNWMMYPLKIIYKIPSSFLELINFEKFIFWFLKSKRYLKNGRSYVMICNSKEKNSNKIVNGLS
jgi:ubiquinone/menaquinone biosynthesis C-methylase UbiE